MLIQLLRRPARLALPLALATLAFAAGAAQAANQAEEQLRFGVSMARRGLWSEALFRFQQADRLQPDQVKVLNNLAVAYEAVGSFDQALDTYQRALKLDPSNRDLKQNYSRFVEFYQSYKSARGEAGEQGAQEGDQPPPPGGGAEPEGG